MLDYIDYNRVKVAEQGPYPNADGIRDTRPLLIVDDVDRFSDAEASYLFTMLLSRAPYLVSLCASRQRFRFLEVAEIPSLELRLGPLPQNDLFALLANYVTAAGGDRNTVGHFLTAFNSHGLRPEYLTPRIVLQLLNSYMHEGDLGRAIAEFASRVSVSNIAIVEHEGRPRALPVLQGPPAGIVAPQQTPLYAAPYIVIPHLAAIWRNQLEEFEELLDDAKSNENSFQLFFERHPHFLKGVDYSRVLAHPSLIREDDGSLIPDFMLQPLGSDFADILDLKRPDAKVVTGRKDRRRFAQSVHEAIAQVREYREYFEHSDHRRAVQERYGFTAYRPDALIVIGRQPEAVSEEEMKRIAGDIPSFVQIQTYDDVLRKMRQLVELKET